MEVVSRDLGCEPVLRKLRGNDFFTVAKQLAKSGTRSSGAAEQRMCLSTTSSGHQQPPLKSSHELLQGGELPQAEKRMGGI